MFYFRHQTLIFISGCIWLVTGCFLLFFGLLLLFGSVQQIRVMAPPESFPLLYWLRGGFERPEWAAMLLVAVCVLLGFFKGNFVLSRSVSRLVRRIRNFPNPTHLLNLYSPAYYLLLMSMMLIGVSIKYFGIPQDIRGAVDVVVGSALLRSSLLYFRCVLREESYL